MQKDYIDYWHENIFLTLLKHHPLYRRMYFDPDFYDVSSEDVKAFIFLMCREQVPKQNIMLLREKYRDILANETVGIQGVINRFGLRFPEHDIRTSGSNIYINGYTIRQWELLTSEKAANLNLTVIKRFINNCVRKGDTSAVEVLTT